MIKNRIKSLVSFLLNKNYYIIFILIFAILIRVPFISDKPNLIDEGYHLSWGSPENNEWLNQRMLSVDFHSPFYYKFTNFLYRLSDSVLVTRLFFLSFGILNIFLLYKLGKKFNCGKIAALLATVNLYSLFHSVHISPYIILPTLTLLSVLVLINNYANFKWINLIYLGIIWGIGIQIHYYFMFLVAPQILILFYILNKEKKLARVVLPLGITFLIFSPILELFIHQLQRAPSSSYMLPYMSLLRILLALSLQTFSHGFSVPFLLSNRIALILGISLFSLCTFLLIKFLFLIKNYNELNILLVSFFGFLLLNTLASLMKFASSHARYYSVIFPLYLLFISIAISNIKNVKIKFVTIILILVLYIIGLLLASSVFPFVNGEVQL